MRGRAVNGQDISLVQGSRRFGAFQTRCGASCGKRPGTIFMSSKCLQINDLPPRACALFFCRIAPIIGIDKCSQSFYFRSRRRPKGLASIICRQSDVGWVIRLARQLVEYQTRKNRLTLRGAVGVWTAKA